MPTTKKSNQEQPAKTLEYRVEQSGSTLSLIKYIGGTRKGITLTYASTDTRLAVMRNFAVYLEQATMEGLSSGYLAHQAEAEAKELAKEAAAPAKPARKKKTEDTTQPSATVAASDKEADAPATQDTH